jgi:hypothetical protein
MKNVLLLAMFLVASSLITFAQKVEFSAGYGQLRTASVHGCFWRMRRLSALSTLDGSSQDRPLRTHLADTGESRLRFSRGFVYTFGERVMFVDVRWQRRETPKGFEN